MKTFLFLLWALPASAAPTNDLLADLDLFRARSLVVRSEQEQLQADQATRLSRLLQFTPRLSAAVGRSEYQTVDPTLVPNYQNGYWYWRAGGDWNLFRGGSDLASWKAAKAKEESQRFQVASQELRTELEGSRVVFRRLYLHDVASAQDELLKLKQQTMRIGRDRYQQGKIPLQDVTKMEVDLSQQQNVVRQATLDLAENEAAYRAFFVDELQTREWPFGPSQELNLTPQTAGSLDQQRLNTLALSLHEGWRSSWYKHLPSLDLSVSYYTPLGGPNPKYWQGTLELSVPIWTRYETASEAAQAYAASVRADDDARNNERAEEARRKFINEKISLSRANMEDARVNLEKSERLYHDMLHSFELGRLSTNDLFLEQDRRIRALLSYSESRLAFHESLMEACALWGYRAAECLRR